MNLATAITIVVPSVFAVTVTNAFMLVTPRLQAVVDIVFISVNTRARCNRGLDEGLDGDLLDVGQPPNDDIATPLAQPNNWQLFACTCAASAFALKPSTPAEAPFFTTASGLPLWPATMYTSSHSTSPLQGGDACLETMPWRN